MRFSMLTAGARLARFSVKGNSGEARGAVILEGGVGVGVML